MSLPRHNMRNTAAPDQPGRLLIERESPCTGEIVSRVNAHNVADCQQFVAKAAAAFPAWSATPPTERATLLLNLANAIQARSTAFCELMTLEMGATTDWGQHNVNFAVEILQQVSTYADELDRIDTIRENGDVISQAVRAPCGVCLGITPWNAPVILGVRAIAAPLLCGNTVLLKGNEVAPATFSLLAEAIKEAHFPEGVAQMFLTRAQDSETIVESIIASPVVRRVNFTGSTRVGRRVAMLCAKHLKRPLLELGGQATMIVLDDADLDAAAEAALYGAYVYQGQLCMSTERLVVTESVADQLIERIEAGRRKIKMGDPASAKNQLGPVVSLEAAERLSGLISDAISKGAKLVGGGGIRDAFVEATLLDKVEADMRIYNEEVFGPVLSVTRVENECEAISVANESEYGLACAVFSSNETRASNLASRLHSGICHINRTTVDDNPHAPFGGVKSSGYGRFGGRWALNEFTELRWITRAGSSFKNSPDQEPALS